MNIKFENVVITDEMVHYYAEKFLEIKENYSQEYNEHLEMDFDLFFENSILEKLQVLNGK